MTSAGSERIRQMGIVRRKTNGISYYMYNNDHEPAHLHVYVGNPSASEYRAKISIESPAVLEGYLPRSRSQEALSWIRSHKRELLRMWHKREQAGSIHVIED